jgi:hypothetical protein
MSQSMMTLEPSQNAMCEPVTCSRQVSPVRTSPTQGNAPGSTERGLDYGAKSQGSFSSYDRDSRSWKTYQLCLDGAWEEFSETWPRSGMTQSGIAFQRRQLERCTIGTGFGLRLIPTPTTCDYKGSGRLRLERGENNNLRDWFKIKFNFLYPPVECVRYLMGYPEGWASLKATEMPSSRKSRGSFSKP